MRSVAPKSFFAHLYEASGVLARVDGALVFFSDAGDVTPVEPADCNFLTVLGEVGLAETARILDALHHNAPAIACSRRQEVL